MPLNVKGKWLKLYLLEMVIAKRGTVATKMMGLLTSTGAGMMSLASRESSHLPIQLWSWNV